MRAGAEVITAATFRTTRYTLAKAGMGDRAAELTALAIRLAREAIDVAGGHAVRLAASLAPLEDCYHPERRPDDETLRREHTHSAGLLKQAGADLILVETQNSLREAQLATEAALNADIPVWTALMPKDATTLFNGDSLTETALVAYALGVDAVLVNCCPVAVAAAALKTLQDTLSAGDVLVGVYPNFSSGQGDPWEFDAPLSAAAFAAWVQTLTPAPGILGGCCGTTPAHIAALANKG